MGPWLLPCLPPQNTVQGSWKDRDKVCRRFGSYLWPDVLSLTQVSSRGHLHPVVWLVYHLSVTRSRIAFWDQNVHFSAAHRCVLPYIRHGTNWRRKQHCRWHQRRLNRTTLRFRLALCSLTQESPSPLIFSISWFPVWDTAIDAPQASLVYLLLFSAAIHH